MLHGFNDARNFYYSLSLINGDGQNFKNADGSFDWMGRAWIAPLSFKGGGPFHDLEIGGSFWTGNRANTLAPTSQTTQSGFNFFNTGSYARPWAAQRRTRCFRPVGRLRSFAGR